ncbi:hypothetical protein [Chryseobacterium gallinarum]|uniref:Uncharacterized protein n=1 Tax=Chryseobacterium gallinarum TaxID=1324352 RepID=A0ABX6KNM0_CHRGL|nr:hypothetical protein [Chryseobacterium gallinarum]QIY89404.1 hypothetical protein FOB44_01505 [Chryseobacterium gallinarum]
MKIKAIKYNKNGLTRAENTVPKFVMPKKDLNKNNVEIKLDNNYIKITRRKFDD